jgi:hypothetical protein
MRDTPKSAGHADCGFVFVLAKLQRRPVNERLPDRHDGEVGL